MTEFGIADLFQDELLCIDHLRSRCESAPLHSYHLLAPRFGGLLLRGAANYITKITGQGPQAPVAESLTLPPGRQEAQALEPLDKHSKAPPGGQYPALPIVEHDFQRPEGRTYWECTRCGIVMGLPNENERRLCK